MRYLPILFGGSLLLAAALLPADAGAQRWDVNTATGPVAKTLEYVASEGTWLSVDIAPDGRTVVFDLLGHIYEVPIEGGDARPLTSGRTWNMFPRYSPDGATIAYTSDTDGTEDIWLLTRSNGTRRNLSRMPSPVYRATWSADGRFLFAVTREHNLGSRIFQFSLLGSRQQLLQLPTPNPANLFIDDPARGVLYFEHNDAPLYASGSRIRSYDRRSGELGVVIQRPGGAMAPALSPDGSQLAYVHRSDLETQLVVRDLRTGVDRVIVRGLDRDRQEYRIYQHGAYPNFAWHPDGSRIIISYGGGIHSVDARTGEARPIPFRAPVSREITATIRFPVPLPQGATRTRAHRWAHRTTAGVLYEALGDIYLHDGTTARNLTHSTSHETSPVYDPRSRTVYYASWSDDERGSIRALRLDRGRAESITGVPAQYGSLALSADGRTLAFLRSQPEGRPILRMQNRFDLVVRSADGVERVLRTIAWGDGQGDPSMAPLKLPPALVIDAAQQHVYYTEFTGNTLTLRRIRLDGSDDLLLYSFPHAVFAVPSPDLQWIAFQEYHRTYVTPFEFIGHAVTVSAEDRAGTTFRVDIEDGLFPGWSADSRTLAWTRGAELLEKPLADVLAPPATTANGGAATRRTDLAITYEVAAPGTTIALTGVRVITMNAQREVIDGATVLIRGDRIAAVGRDVAVPADARVFDLAGHTVMPGIVDVHAHYGSAPSVLNVIEQRMATLHAALAYGVTTMYEVAGNNFSDFWVSDMLRSGRMTGPRLLSAGARMYGMRVFRPRHFRSIQTLDDAREHVRLNKAAGATALKDYLTMGRAVRQMIAIAAREEGLNLVAEPSGDAHLNLTRAMDGFTGLEHGMGFTPLHDDVIRFMAASGTGITPTLVVTLDGARGTSYFHQTERIWEDEKLTRFYPADRLLAFRRPVFNWPDDQYSRGLAANMKRLYDAGVPVQLGGHGEMPGLDVHWEMELLAQGGFTPHEVLEIATINGARYHGLDAQVGSIEAGKLADLVVLRADPLTEIRNTRSIRYVLSNGVVYSGDDAARVFPDPQPAASFHTDRGVQP